MFDDIFVSLCYTVTVFWFVFLHDNKCSKKNKQLFTFLNNWHLQ